ncbi:LpqB family beta-propeller domain-containing protein [Nocardioides sp. WV_118_6]|uniref:LpqB family beta-propeller domain-containing protein n=1 Tax=Nocardioides simplex TaxID=2045 RepID=UPI0021505920|nr:LpqB family beta-propeller domain-containing protein [Pimelobacter simplex]UUW89531.1 LpqB family beta-propeller domain-containing protein [Pimelobacter simplex]UUW93360.1 LpqB family beta-propeller domain-containing protein [Pimelobacter simplex]
MNRRLPLTLAAALALAVALSGCVSLPTSGPVVESAGTDRTNTRRASDIDARPPATGATRSEVVNGFLDAMTAWPIQTSVAKEYLTDEAAAGWNPEQETIIYSDSLPVRETAGTVAVQLTAADRLDQIGAWRGAIAKPDLTMNLHVTIDKGEYRIADPPDALVVPASWFRQRYRQVSLFYFDPLAQILVPEPVFVPEGDQLASSLVSALLSGPPPLARGIVRSFLPPGLTVGLSVPVDDEGIAHVALVGEAPKVTSEEAELMLAQLAWTLRQDPTISALRVTLDGTDLPLPGGASQYSVESASAFGPAGPGSGHQVYGISRGRLVAGPLGELELTTGVFGAEDAGVVSVAVRPDGERAAAVDSDGRRVRIATVRADDDVPPRTVLSGGQYARPTWDNAGRLWVLDRRSGDAVVWLVEGEDGVARQVDVDGVSGTRARSLAVSRDGTRLVAVVRGAGGDRVVGARVVIGGRGKVSATREPSVVRPPDGNRITDLAWTSPIQIGLLAPTSPGALSEVDVVSADGATVGVDALSTIVTGRVLGFAASPVADAPMLAVYADRYVDVVRQEEYDTGSLPLTQLDYAG